MRKIIVEFIVGWFLASLGLVGFFWFFGWLVDVGLCDVPFFLYYDAFFEPHLTAAFLGMPMGALVGVILVDKVIFKSPGHIIIPLAVGFMLSELGVLVGLWFVGAVLRCEIDEPQIFLVPLVVACFCVVGYNMRLVFKKRTAIVRMVRRKLFI